jgi:hypothetical protein
MTVPFDTSDINYFIPEIETVIAPTHQRAADTFSVYRKTIRRNMVTSWWTDLVSDTLQRFYEDLIYGVRPKLVIEAPPQHGKSAACEDFVSWLAGKNPELKTIFASHSDGLGIRTNLEVQRVMNSPAYQQIFPKTRIGLRNFQWQVNGRCRQTDQICRH